MDEGGEQPSKPLTSVSQIKAPLGSSEWLRQMEEVRESHKKKRQGKPPTIQERLDLEAAMREERAQKIRAGKIFSTNPNNPKNRSTPLSTAGNYQTEKQPLRALDDWPA